MFSNNELDGMCLFFGMSFCRLKKKSMKEKPDWANTFVLFLWKL